MPSAPLWKCYGWRACGYRTCHKQALQLYKQAAGKSRHLLVFIKLGVCSLFLRLPKALPGGEFTTVPHRKPQVSSICSIAWGDESWPWAWLANFLGQDGCVVMGLSQIWPSNLFSPSLPQIPIIRRCDRNLCLPLCLRGKKGNIVSFFESWFLEHDEVELWWPPTSFFPMFFWDPFLYNILILDADRSLCLPP